VEKIKCDYLVLAGHKFYGPRIGALYVRDPSLLQPMLFGGGQERSLRPGTENTPMIVGLGEAARLVNEHLATYAAQMRHTRNILKEKLSALTPVTWLSEEPCLPNTLLVSLPEISSGKEFIESLGGQVLASTGAACHSGSVGSSVLNACGIDFEVQKRTIRFSTGRATTEEQILRAVNLIGASLGRLQDSKTQKIAE